MRQGNSLLGACVLAGMVGTGLATRTMTMTDEERAARRKARNDAYLAELRAQEERDRPIIEAAAAKRARKNAKRRALLSPNDRGN